MTFVV